VASRCLFSDVAAIFASTGRMFARGCEAGRNGKPECSSVRGEPRESAGLSLVREKLLRRNDEGTNGPSISQG